jgi:hypothetical protein
LHAINSDTGEGIWNIAGMFAPQAIADGYLLATNGYDNKLYCFGKGPSETTVSVSPKIVQKGESVLIEGTILDMSPAQPGTPCVSKEFMSDWMEFLHMQDPHMPMVTKGVPILLFYMGIDGQLIELDTVVSDNSGFAYEWTPPDEDMYTILALFAGDDSYGLSTATTHIKVNAAVSPDTPIEPEEPVTSLISTEVAIILAVVVIAVIGGAAYWVLRRRK